MKDEILPLRIHSGNKWSLMTATRGTGNPIFSAAHLENEKE